MEQTSSKMNPTLDVIQQLVIVYFSDVSVCLFSAFCQALLDKL